MFKALRSACLFAFVSAVAVLSMPGCSQQGQGERCESINGDADCNDGLTCVPGSKLGGTVDRCCPAENTETDSRCQRRTSSGNTAGTSSGGTSSGGTGGGGTNSGGMSAAGEASGGMSSLPEAGGAGGTPDSALGGTSNSSAGTPAITAGAANATAGAGGAP